jgi:hypothetical protein
MASNPAKPSKLKEWYHNLRPEKRKVVFVGMVAAGIAMFGVVTFFISPFSNAPPPISIGLPLKAALNIDSKLLERSTTSRVESQQKTLRGFFKHLLYSLGLAQIKGYPSPFHHTFRE